MFKNALMKNLANVQPTHWQLGFDGQWETAKTIPLQETSTNIASLLSAAPQDTAIELFFQTPRNQCAFFGMRLKALSSADQIACVRNLISAVGSGDKPEDVFEKIEVVLNESFHTQTPLFEKSPAFLEIGFEGFWNSKGSVIVWNEGDNSVLPTNTIRDKAPQLLDPFEKPLMLEHAWKAPAPTWLALQISKYNNGYFEFSAAHYKALTKAVTHV